MIIITGRKNFLSLTLAAVMLTGCAGNGSSSSVSDGITIETDTVTISGEATTYSKPKENVTITIAVSGELDDELKKQMADFNAEDNGYFIKTKIYSFESETIDPKAYRQNMYSADFEFLQDMINTDDIDIVYSGSYVNGSSYESLKNKGAFVDLYPFMENDSEVNPSTLNSHILKLNETDGKLYGFPTYYALDTLVGRQEYVGDKENWTVDELIEKWNKAPNGMKFGTSPYAESAYRTLFRNVESYLDFENAEVHFDSDAFRCLLELCGSLPSNDNQKYEIDDWSDVFLFNFSFEGIINASSFNDNTYYYGSYGNLTFAGFPSSDGSGALLRDKGNRFSICSSSSDEEQRGAWEFIRRFYTYEYQKENDIMLAKDVTGTDIFSSERGLCINERAFDDIAHEIIAGKYYSKLNENLTEDWQKYQIPTEDDYKEFRRYINETKKCILSPDVELRDIVDEEVFAYLAGGQSLDQTINLIQNRASVWMSEKS